MKASRLTRLNGCLRLVTRLTRLVSFVDLLALVNLQDWWVVLVLLVSLCASFYFVQVLTGGCFFFVGSVLFCWEYQTKDGKKRARCKHCGDTYACGSGSNGTTNMNTHIRKRCKKYRPPVTNSRQTFLVKQPNVEGAGSTLGTSRFSVEECRRALAEMFILDELPFRFVENRGFRKFCFAMNPRFDVPSRRTIVRDLYKLYVEERMKLKKYFKSSQKRILSFSQITDHTGESIGRCIEKVLLEWGIDKIFTITMDNATANAVAIGYMSRKLNSWREDGTILGGKYLHLRCCAHILNLIVGDGLKDLHKSVVAIRNAVKYVKSSPSRLDRFKRAIEHEKLGNHGFVVLDVPTWWNSTYLMLESAVKLRKAFERMEEEDGHYVLYFNDKEGDEKRIGPPLLDDWENAKVFIRFLSTFYDITLDFSASLHVTSNIYFKSWCTIFNQLTSLSTERDPLVSRMAVSMKQKFDKYWKGIDKTNNLLIIAVVLDPRYIFGYVKWRFDAFFGVTQSHSMISSLKEVLVNLYEYYVTQYGSVSVRSNDDMSSFRSGLAETFYEKEKFREDSLWGQKQQEEDVSMGKSEVELYLLEPFFPHLLFSNPHHHPSSSISLSPSAPTDGGKRVEERSAPSHGGAICSFSRSHLGAAPCSGARPRASSHRRSAPSDVVVVEEDWFLFIEEKLEKD
ncbi:hypothetical protein EZV62_001474 [Acer yangbiense]|uniref:BED-type domain-containing protein n=1 Tax=Acer yangbiense TaxID=1000413 RepID=A0A5C7IUM8_9ROSI|nr:hypothetical protein EZV62_001474 [Acer yangbiense]